MSDNPRPPTIGTLDHFEDMVEKLDELEVAYVLMVGMPNTTVINSWTNGFLFGVGAVKEFISSSVELFEDQLEMAAEAENDED